MQSFQQNDDGDSLLNTISFKQMRSIKNAQQQARPATKRVKLRADFDLDGRKRMVLGKSASVSTGFKPLAAVLPMQKDDKTSTETGRKEDAQMLMQSSDQLYKYL